MLDIFLFYIGELIQYTMFLFIGWFLLSHRDIVQDDFNIIMLKLKQKNSMFFYINLFYLFCMLIMYILKLMHHLSYDEDIRLLISLVLFLYNIIEYIFREDKTTFELPVNKDAIYHSFLFLIIFFLLMFFLGFNEEHNLYYLFVFLLLLVLHYRYRSYISRLFRRS
jgi:hypothetical protein